MIFELYSDVVLTRDIPSSGLLAGDVVKVVDHHPVSNGEDGWSIEVFNAIGETIAVTTVSGSSLEEMVAEEVLSVRKMAV